MSPKDALGHHEDSVCKARSPPKDMQLRERVSIVSSNDFLGLHEERLIRIHPHVPAQHGQAGAGRGGRHSGVPGDAVGKGEAKGADRCDGTVGQGERGALGMGRLEDKGLLKPSRSGCNLELRGWWPEGRPRRPCRPWMGGASCPTRQSLPPDHIEYNAC